MAKITNVHRRMYQKAIEDALKTARDEASVNYLNAVGAGIKAYVASNPEVKRDVRRLAALQTTADNAVNEMNKIKENLKVYGLNADIFKTSTYSCPSADNPVIDYAGVQVQVSLPFRCLPSPMLPAGIYVGKAVAALQDRKDELKDIGSSYRRAVAEATNTDELSALMNKITV